MEVLRKLKADKRSEAGLPDIKEDTLTVSKTMRAASPPASAADILEATNNRRNNRPSKISNYVFENRIIKIKPNYFYKQCSSSSFLLMLIIQVQTGL